MADPLFRDNVFELCSTPGTGNIVLAGTSGFYFRFRDRYALGVRFPYGIEDDSVPAFEIGIGYLLTEEILVREEVKDGTSGPGVHIDFSASVKRIFVTDPGWMKNENTAKVSDRHYAHDQATPSAVWLVTHNLGKQPAVTVVDSAGTLVMGHVEHLSTVQTRLTFQSAFSGKAYFN